MKKLREYQKLGAEFLGKRKCALLADDMGLGKTAQAIVAAETKNQFPWVIVCPSSVKNQWAAAIDEWTADLYRVQVIRSGEDEVAPASIYIMSYRMAEKFSQDYKGKIGVLILDEAHFCKSLDAQRTLVCLGKEYLGGRSNNIWALTGTPVYNRPVDLYPLLLTMYPKALMKSGSYEEFAKRYNGAYWYKQSLRMGKARHTDELRDILQNFMLRRLKKDVLDELPTIDVSIVDVDLCGSSRLTELNDKYAKTKEYNEVQDFIRDSRGALSKLSKEYAFLKLDFAKEYIKNELEKYEKIFVVTYHRAVAEELRLGLRNFSPVVYQGGMSDTEKSEALEAFQGEQCRVLIGQIRAAGTGLDGLQKVCSRTIFVEWDQAPGAVVQTIDRLYRIGQVKGVNITFLVTPNSKESEDIRKMMDKRQDVKKIIG